MKNSSSIYDISHLIKIMYVGHYLLDISQSISYLKAQANRHYTLVIEISY